MDPLLFFIIADAGEPVVGERPVVVTEQVYPTLYPRDATSIFGEYPVLRSLRDPYRETFFDNQSVSEAAAAVAAIRSRVDDRTALELEPVEQLFRRALKENTGVLARGN